MEIRKARGLRPGDTIGILSPSSGQLDYQVFEDGAKLLREWGFHVVFSPNAREQIHYLAGTDRQRADDLNEFFARPDIDAILTSGGGYGAGRILSMLDYRQIAAHPKIICGFSDVTNLLLAIRKKAGLVTFHGPTLANLVHSSKYGPMTAELWLKAVTRSEVPYRIGAEPGTEPVTISGGCAEGELLGGNLCIMTFTLGTPYEVDTEGKILLMEDLNTPPWIMDHYLAHLRNAGKLERIRGVVIGTCYECDATDFDNGSNILSVFEEYLKPLGIPVLYGLPLGHAGSIATLPIGGRVKLDADNKCLYVMEQGVTF